MHAADAFQGAVQALREHDLERARVQADALDAEDDPRAAVIRAHVHLASFDTDAAVASLRRALADRPTAIVWHCLAQILLDLGDQEGGLHAFVQAELHDDIPFSVLRLERATATLAAGDPQAALDLIAAVPGFETAELATKAEQLVFAAHRAERGERLVQATFWRVDLTLPTGDRMVLEGVAERAEQLVDHAQALGLPAGGVVAGFEAVRNIEDALVGVHAMQRIQSPAAP